VLIDDCVALLRARDIQLEPGLSPYELSEIETRFEFEFSTDHRNLLERVLPVGNPWVNWREESDESIRDRFDVARGILFDVENDAFWPETWGIKPTSVAQQLTIAAEQVSRWPRLVPLFAHRYMPAAPAPTGSPVFSVHQTDVIPYGDNLLDYLRQEFGPVDRDYPRRPFTPEVYDVWTQLVFGEDPTYFESR